MRGFLLFLDHTDCHTVVRSGIFKMSERQTYEREFRDLAAAHCPSSVRFLLLCKHCPEEAASSWDGVKAVLLFIARWCQCSTVSLPSRHVEGGCSLTLQPFITGGMSGMQYAAQQEIDAANALGRSSQEDMDAADGPALPPGHPRFTMRAFMLQRMMCCHQLLQEP